MGARGTSILPACAFLFTWIAWAIFLPLETNFQFVLAFAASVVLALLVRLLLPQKAKAGDPMDFPLTGKPEVDEVIRDGSFAATELRRMYERIQDVRVAERVLEMITVNDKIIKKLAAEPQHVNEVRRFLGYYLPTSLQLVHTYVRLDGQTDIDVETLSVLRRIEKALDTLLLGYHKQLTEPTKQRAEAVERDIEKIEQILEREQLIDADLVGR
jgi:hypothetical protein